MRTPLTRRAALAYALVGIPAVAGPALAASASLTLQSTPDPIFAAIERHRDAWRYFESVLNRVDEVLARQHGREVTPEDERVYEAASRVECAAMATLCDTPPKSVAGMRAAIEHFVKHEDGCEPEISGYFLATLLRSRVLSG